MIVRAVPSIDDLVTEHMNLVVLVVRSMRAMPCVKRLGDEAQSVGQFALFRAAKKFGSGPASFRTYATKSIRRAIFREAVKHDRALGIALVTPDAREKSADTERCERTMNKSVKRRRERLRKQLGIYEQQ